jgi:hypothetical protein
LQIGSIGKERKDLVTRERKVHRSGKRV